MREARVIGAGVGKGEGGRGPGVMKGAGVVVWGAVVMVALLVVQTSGETRHKRAGETRG